MVLINGIYSYEEEKELIELVDLAYDRHRFFCKDWSNGEPIEAWFDEDRNVCVRYESGNWWHYKDLDLPFPSWW